MRPYWDVGVFGGGNEKGYANFGVSIAFGLGGGCWLWDYEFVAFAVDVYDFDFGVVFDDFAEFGDVDVHAACVVGGAFEPDGFEGVVALENAVGILHEEGEEVALFGGEFCDAVDGGEGLFLDVEYHAAELVFVAILVAFAVETTHNGFDAEKQFFHREWFVDIVVGTDAEALEDVVFEGFGCQEDDWDVVVGFADVLSEREAVFFRHHYVEDAEVEFVVSE